MGGSPEISSACETCGVEPFGKCGFDNCPQPIVGEFVGGALDGAVFILDPETP